MPKCLEILFISVALYRGLMVLQQLAHCRQSIWEKASSCKSGSFFSTPLLFFVCNFFRSFLFDFLAFFAFSFQPFNCLSIFFHYSSCLLNISATKENT